MFDLPSTTVVNRFIPKEKFYSKTTVNAKLRQLFIDEIDKISWANKISTDTLNISAGELLELQVFEIILKGGDINMTLLKHIDTFIPYPILFIVKKPRAMKAVLAFKELNTQRNKLMKVDTYYQTNWANNVGLKLQGRSVDEIYKNFLFQIAPPLQHASQTTAKAAVETTKIRDKLQKQIDAITKKLANEPSIAKRQEIARQRHELQEQLKQT